MGADVSQWPVYILGACTLAAIWIIASGLAHRLLGLRREVGPGPAAPGKLDPGVELFRRGDLHGAAHQFRVALGNHSTNLNARVALGYCCLEAGEDFHGERELVAAARIDNALGELLGVDVTPYGPFFQPEELAGLPSHMRIDREWGFWPDIQAGNYARPLSRLENSALTGAGLHMEDTALTDLFRACCLQGLGSSEDAAHALGSALRRDDRDAFILYQAGKLHREADEVERALDLHARLVELHPRYALSHYALGRTRWRLGEEGDAMRSFEDAEKRAGIHPELWLLLGETYLELSEREAAVRALRQSLQVAGPPREFAGVIQRAGRRLESLGERAPGPGPAL